MSSQSLTLNDRTTKIRIAV